MASTRRSAGAQNNAHWEPTATTTETRSKGVRLPPPRYEDIDQYRRTSQAHRPPPPTSDKSCRRSAATTKETYASGVRLTTMPDANYNSNKPEATQISLARDGKAGSIENVECRPRKGTTDDAVSEDEPVFNSEVEARGSDGDPGKVEASERTTRRRSKSERFKRPQNRQHRRSKSVSRVDGLAVARANASWNASYGVSDKGTARGDSALKHIEPRRRYDLIDTTESRPEAADARWRGRRLNDQTSASEEEDGLSVFSTKAVDNFETGLRTDDMYDNARKGQKSHQPPIRTIWSVPEDDGTAEGTVEDTIDSTDAVQTRASNEEYGGSVFSTKAVSNFERGLRTDVMYENGRKDQISHQPPTRTSRSVSEDDGTAQRTVEDTIDSTDAVYNFVRDYRAVLELIELATAPNFEEQYNENA